MAPLTPRQQRRQAIQAGLVSLIHEVSRLAGEVERTRRPVAVLRLAFAVVDLATLAAAALQDDADADAPTDP